jgi:hypothetical protein
MILTLCTHLHHAATHSAAPTLGNTESDWIRRIGALTGLIGAVIAAWHGAIWVARGTRDFGVKWWRNMRAQLANFWLCLRRKPTTRQVSLADAGAGASMIGTATTSASGLVWNPGASAGEKADILYSEILKIYERINELDQTVRTNHTEIQALVETQVGEVREAHRRLEALLAAKERHETRVDGRGLLLVAAGILLTGMPDELAHYPALGWTITALAALLTAVVLRAVIRDSG